MSVQNVACMQAFARLCSDGFAFGWHEANGGNLSYRLTDEDITVCESDFIPASERGPWNPICAGNQTYELPQLGGAYFAVTGSGKFLRNVELDLASNVGILEINATGSAWRVVWGLQGGAHPTSELVTHLRAHDVRMRATQGANRVVYHAHCPNIVALSTLIAADTRTWTRMLWGSMTECVIVFPEGLGVAPWMVPGSPELAQATCDLMAQHRVIIWSLHGVMAAGESFDQAFGAVHTVEKTAGLYLQARAANGGQEPPLMVSDDQLRAVCARYGLTPNEAFLNH